MYPWASPDEKTFNVRGCILFLLFAQSGQNSYPEFDLEYLEQKASPEFGCGWNEGYDRLSTKYKQSLRQTRPKVTPRGRGSSLGEPKKVVSIKTKEEELEELKAKRFNFLIM